MYLFDIDLEDIMLCGSQEESNRYRIIFLKDGLLKKHSNGITYTLRQQKLRLFYRTEFTMKGGVIWARVVGGEGDNLVVGVRMLYIWNSYHYIM